MLVLLFLAVAVTCGAANARPEQTRREASMESASAADAPAMNGANLALRFGLEVGALATLGWWGYENGDGAAQWPMAVGLPLAAAALWGTFTVAGDPSRGGEGLIQVPGVVRLAGELGLFGLATWALSDLDHANLAVGFGAATVVHYGISHERVVVQRCVGAGCEDFANHIGAPGENIETTVDPHARSGRTYRYRVYAARPTPQGPAGTGVSNVIEVEVP
jgi:hypothetical protein